MARVVIDALKHAIVARTDCARKHLATASLPSNGTNQTFTAGQRRIEGDGVFSGAFRHWWCNLTRLIFLAGPDTLTSANVAVTFDLGVDRSVGTSLISKAAAVVTDFHRGALTALGRRNVVLKLATLERLSCHGLVGIKPDRIRRILFFQVAVLLLDLNVGRGMLRNHVRFTSE